MAKPTPGPWILDDPIHAETITESYHYIEAGEGFLGSLDNPKGFTTCGVMSIHDAKLIAASPDLLAALQEVLQTIKNNENWWIDCPTKGGFDVDMIQAAIKKATA